MSVLQLQHHTARDHTPHLMAFDWVQRCLKMDFSRVVSDFMPAMTPSLPFLLLGKKLSLMPNKIWPKLMLHERFMPDQDCAIAMTPDQFKSEMISLLPRLRRFALSLTRSGPDADDLLQDACSAALQKWHTFDPAQPMDRWMFRIIRNLWISEIRKRKVRMGEGQVPAEDSTELRTESNVDEVLTAQQVHRQVEDLEKDLSQPLLLVCAEGYSYREASELLDIPIGTVMSRIHRARKLLVSRLTAEECVAR